MARGDDAERIDALDPHRQRRGIGLGRAVEALSPRGAERARGHACRLPKGFRERLARLEAGIERDVGDAPLACAQRVRRALQPQPPDRLGDRFAGRGAPQAMEVEGRKRGFRGQPVERQRLVDPVGHQGQHAREAGGEAVEGKGAHRRTPCLRCALVPRRRPPGVSWLAQFRAFSLR